MVFPTIRCHRPLALQELSSRRGNPRGVTAAVRRAGAFALVGTLALVAPILGRLTGPPFPVLGATVPFLLVAAFGLGTSPGSAAFDLFARRGDRQEGRLYGLAGFALAAAGLGLLTRFGLPYGAFVGGILVVAGGNLAQAIVRTRWIDPFVATAGFAGGGALTALAGIVLAGVVTGNTVVVPLAVFLATSAALAAGLLRAVLFEGDDPLAMVGAAFLLWFVIRLVEAESATVPPTRVGVGVGVTLFLGWVAYVLGTASIPGMLTGILLALFAVVLGGYGWFAVLITFFGVGGLASKFRYQEKRARGIAQSNEGARGSGNVLANSAVALVAVLAFAASEYAGVAPELFRVAFAGSVAGAMSDTLSSEVGGLYDDPRLITTFEVVDPGTDGAITVQGELAGLAGAGLIAGIAVFFFDWGALAAGVVVLGGAVGMTVDSVLGATLEGSVLGNQGVNLLATASAAAVAFALAIGVGMA